MRMSCCVLAADAASGPTPQKSSKTGSVSSNEVDTGTTAICCLIVGTTLLVGNVGDSRCILGRERADGGIAAKALSVDQTPYRKDERERVKKVGARVMTVDQVEGKERLHEDWGTNLGEEIDE